MNVELTQNTNFCVLINHEEQYSLWQSDHPVPAGWHEIGPRGTREQCLAFVREVWIDMRPLSLRQAMQCTASEGRAAAPRTADPERLADRSVT